MDKRGDRDPDYWITDLNPTTGIFERLSELVNTFDNTRVCISRVFGQG